MKIIWHGTASFGIETDDGKILTDPFVPLKGSTVPVKISDFDGFPVLLVTHGHFDHIVSIPKIIKRNPTAKVFCTTTPFKTLLKKGVPRENLTEITDNSHFYVQGIGVHTFRGKHAVLPKISIKLLWSIIATKFIGNIPYIMIENHRCRDNDETLFYEFTIEGKKIVLLGSLNLSEETEYPTEADLLLLPYNGWSDNFGPAVTTIERLKPKKIILHHFDITFPPVTTKIDIDPILDKYGDLITVVEPNTPFEF